MPAPFLDVMATIPETIDNFTSDGMAEQLSLGYKIVRVAEANQKTKSSPFPDVFSTYCNILLLPVLNVVQLSELLTYLGLLIWTAAMKGAGLCPKLFALSQVLDELPTVLDNIVNVCGTLRPLRKMIRDTSIYIVEGDDVPGVDLIITACKESVDIVLDTVKAALDLDYPASKLRVIVSDDGRDPALKAALAPLGHVFSNLMYFTRPHNPNKHHGFKAGNMNDTLKMLKSEDLDPNPWVCVLDADMIPDREMLRVLMAPAMQDSLVGLVSLPQDFYNIPVNDPLHENLVLQHQKEQIARDAHDAAWCPGSGFIFSRAAWEEVGGFAEFSMCDDVFFGWSLNGAGYKTGYVNACHQCGLQPESFQDHLKQRRRWFVGGVRNATHLRFGFGHPLLAKMSFMQRLLAMNQLPKPYLSTLVKAIAVFLNITCLYLGITIAAPVVNVATEDFVRILYAYAFHRLAGLVFDQFAAMKYGHNVRRRAVVGIWQGIHLAKAAIDDMLPSWLGGYTLGFEVTGAKTGGLVLKERDPAIRPSTGIRLSIANQTERVLFHPVLFFIIAGLTAWNVHHIVWAARSWDIMWFWLIIGPLFPGLKLENSFAHLAPLWYFISPPTVKDRKEDMYLDERTGGYRPKKEARGVRFTNSMWVWEAINLAGVAWSLFALWKMAGGIDFSWFMVRFFPLPFAVPQALLVPLVVTSATVTVVMGVLLNKALYQEPGRFLKQ